MSTERLSNVIGAPFSQFVLDQLKIRTRRNSIGTGTNGRRSNEEILFLANKMSWVKLTSSVKIRQNEEVYADLADFYKSYELDVTKYKNEDDLRKNWILQAGTSYSGSTGIGLRTGLGPEGAYGMGGTVSSGYRPMPGLTNVTVESKGVLGSLREANLEFKVWNIEQLNVIEALYFRLGYSMILEWGHVQYYANVSDRNVDGKFEKSDGGIDAFTNTRKEEIQQAIAKKRKNTSGNYDGMLGVVSNFTWSFNKEGGYDCTLKIIGLGSIIDTLRINLSYKMPNAIFIEYEKQQKAQERVIRERAERQAAINRAKAEAAAEKNRPKAGPLPPPPTNIDQLYDPIFKYDQPKTNISLTTFASNSSYYTHLGTNDSVSSFRNYYYLATGQDSIRLNNQRTGLYLTRDSKNFTNFIPGDVKPNHPQPVVLNTKLLEDRATFADNKTFLAVAQLAFNSNFQFSNTFLAPYIKSSNLLQSLLGTDYYFALDAREVNSLGGWVDINLSRKESITNDINNTIKFRSKQFNTNPEDIDQISFVYTYQQPINDNDENRYRQFYFIFNITKSSNQSWNSSLRILQNWLSSSQPIWNITDLFSVNYTRDNTAGLATLLNNLVGVVLPAGFGGIYSYKDLVISGPLQLQPDPDTGLKPTIKFTTNDPNYITQVLTRPPATVAIGMDGNLGGGGNTFVFINNSTAEQKDEAQKFASALHAMLYAVKSEVQTQAEKGSLKNKSGSAVSILKITKDFFVDGILYGVLDSSTSTASDSGTPFKVIPYARKGFNSSLMIDPDKFNKISDVDFNALCTAYYIKFKIENNTNPYNYPVYIKFGYLLAFLNSMCLIYDSKQDTDKRPYVYLDFHPEYNFCLTTPYHLSVDPLTCMIPYQGTDQQYKELFPKDIVDTVFTAKNPPLTKDNPTSKFLTAFKNEKNVYQGKTMEILLSVDFLLNTLKSFTTNDATHTINLKGFLDAVVVGINKSCGNINMFRVSYDDDSNTVVIKDDQFVPNRADEPNTLSRPGYTSTSNVDPMYGMIPIFGLNSMIREFEFKTNINTAMSKQIAISAQRTPDAVNSTDHTSYSYLNRDFEDAYKPQVTDSTKLTSAAKTETDKKALSNDVDQAKKFNSHIFAIYQGNGYLNAGRIDFAINYYINSMADRKSLDLTTQSAQFISANLNMTIDGISGIVMGNAFTIPEDRLPRSLRGNGVQTKVGFIVSGLMHTLDNNQWLTKIKGQMIRLQEVKRKQTAQQNTTKPTVPATTVVPVATTTGIPECPKFYPTLYSGAPLVPETESINTQNVKQYYPTVNFVRGTSNIPVTVSAPLLNENEIIDDTRKNRFDLGLLDTNSRGGIPLYINSSYSLDSTDIKNVYEEFYCLGRPSQYVIDLQGNIRRFMPDGLKNGSRIFNDGIEVRIVGKSTEDINDLQVRNAARLIRYLGYDRGLNFRTNIFFDKIKVFLDNL